MLLWHPILSNHSLKTFIKNRDIPNKKTNWIVILKQIKKMIQNAPGLEIFMIKN